MSGTLWLLAGPPFAEPIYRGTVARLAATRPDLRVQVRSVVAAGPTPEAAGASLAAEVGAEDVVVAHALAVPVALHLAAARPVARLVLLNGPLTELDAASAAVVRLAALPGAADTVFHPAAWLAWLRSSVGLRRAVANPYAMDRDTVAALCGPLVADRAARRALVAWLRALSAGWPSAAEVPSPVTLFWGDNDRIHPLSEPGTVESVRGAGTLKVAPGGRFAWPEELPWLLADSLSAWLPAAAAPSREPSARPTTTPTSHKAGSAPAATPRKPKKTKVGGK